jgi:hypothetical protein
VGAVTGEEQPMRITQLIDILRDYPPDWEVRTALVAPVEPDDVNITVDHYSIEGAMPWKDDELDQTFLWLVSGEDDNVEAFLDTVDE